MAFASGGLNRASTRDSAPGPRFFFFAAVSVVLMYFDQRDGWSERIRYGLSAVAYPIQVVIGSPGKLWYATADLFETRAGLRAENAALLKRDSELALKTLRYEALEQENTRLRNLTASLPALITRTQTNCSSNGASSVSCRTRASIPAQARQGTQRKTTSNGLPV